MDHGTGARPRVLSVITRLTLGGSDRRLFDVLRGVAADHTVLIGGGSVGSQLDRLPPGCEVVVSEALTREVDPRADTAALQHLVRTIRRGAFDVVHTHQAKAGLLGRIAARAAGTPIVYHSASMASFGPGYGALESEVFARAERLTAPLVTRYFVVGSDLARRLAANGVSPRQLEVVRSSLDLGAFRAVPPAERAALRRRWDIDPDALVVCFVGLLEARKGVLDLPGIVAGAAAGRPTVLLVAGEGPLRADLEELARSGPAGLDIRLLGFVDGVAEVMALSDALVLPSSAEGLPQVLVQAAASSLPFACYDVDGAAELAGAGARGAIAPLGDPKALSAALGELLDRRAAGASGGGGLPRRFWDAWDPDAVAARYGAVYEADLAAARVRPRTSRLSGRRGCSGQRGRSG